MYTYTDTLLKCKYRKQIHSSHTHTLIMKHKLPFQKCAKVLNFSLEVTKRLYLITKSSLSTISIFLNTFAQDDLAATIC